MISPRLLHVRHIDCIVLSVRPDNIKTEGYCVGRLQMT